MALGAFEKEGFQAPMAEINVTPFVDVMLVLLVIFLVTAPMLTHAVKLELPNETTTEVRDHKPITLSVDASGQYYWDNAPLTSETLDTKLREAAANNPKQFIHLRADAGAAYGRISHILAAAQRAGLRNIGFITEPK